MNTISLAGDFISILPGPEQLDTLMKQFYRFDII